MIDTLDPAVVVGDTGARGDFSHSQKFVHGMWQLGGQVQSIIGEEADRTHPKRRMYSLTKMSAAPSFPSRDGVHVWAPTEPIREEM